MKERERGGEEREEEERRGEERERVNLLGRLLNLLFC